METLAYLHISLAYETPKEVSFSPIWNNQKLFAGLNWKKLSSRASIHFLSLAVSLVVLGMASDALAQRVLQQGSRDPEVAQVQRRLQDLNYFRGSITGFFGSQTRAAVIEFQRNNGLAPDGEVGSATRAALFNVRRPQSQQYNFEFGNDVLPRLTDDFSNFDRPLDTNNLGERDVFREGDRAFNRRVQLRLRQLRYNPGPIDGIIGPQTRQAIREFQRDRDIFADGRLDRETLEELGVRRAVARNRPLSYVVIVPGSENELDDVRQCLRLRVGSVNFRTDSRLGNYVQTGAFPDYNRAESQSEFLRSCGLDARVVYRQ